MSAVSCWLSLCDCEMLIYAEWFDVSDGSADNSTDCINGKFCRSVVTSSMSASTKEFLPVCRSSSNTLANCCDASSWACSSSFRITSPCHPPQFYTQYLSKMKKNWNLHWNLIFLKVSANKNQKKVTYHQTFLWIIYIMVMKCHIETWSSHTMVTRSYCINTNKPFWYELSARKTKDDDDDTAIMNMKYDK